MVRSIWLTASSGRWYTENGRESFIDHANCDPNDNRLSNLRLATVSQNAANQRNHRASDLPKGITWHKKTKKWQAQIKKDGKNYHLGLFTDPADAHEAYACAARELFGEFARAA